MADDDIDMKFFLPSGLDDDGSPGKKQSYFSSLFNSSSSSYPFGSNLGRGGGGGGVPSLVGLSSGSSSTVVPPGFSSTYKSNSNSSYSHLPSSTDGLLYNKSSNSAHLRAAPTRVSDPYSGSNRAMGSLFNNSYQSSQPYVDNYSSIGGRPLNSGNPILLSSAMPPPRPMNSISSSMDGTIIGGYNIDRGISSNNVRGIPLSLGGPIGGSSSIDRGITSTRNGYYYYYYCNFIIIIYYFFISILVIIFNYVVSWDNERDLPPDPFWSNPAPIAPPLEKTIAPVGAYRFSNDEEGMYRNSNGNLLFLFFCIFEFLIKF